MSEEVRLQELIAQKEAQNRLLQAENERQTLKPVARASDKKQRRERWPKDLAVEQELIEPAEVRDNPEAFRCIGEELTEMLDFPAGEVFPTSDHSPQVRAPR